MKKSEFKKLIKECLRDIIIEEQFLSNIIAESVKGVLKANIINENNDKSRFMIKQHNPNNNKTNNDDFYQNLKNSSRVLEEQFDIKEEKKTPIIPLANSMKKIEDFEKTTGLAFDDPGVPLEAINYLMSGRKNG